MRRILVSQRVDILFDRSERRDALDQKLTALLSFIDAIVLPVPNYLVKNNKLCAWLLENNADGVVLSGGNDLGEAPERDETEFQLMNYAKLNKKPLLGICRAMQIMAAYEGIGLIPVKGHVRTKHKLRGEIEGEVNSFHNFSIETCPNSYRCLAYSEDQHIEAIRHNELPWEGWMWHPERSPIFSQLDLRRLIALLG